MLVRQVAILISSFSGLDNLIHNTIQCNIQYNTTAYDTIPYNCIWSNSIQSFLHSNPSERGLNPYPPIYKPSALANPLSHRNLISQIVLLFSVRGSSSNPSRSSGIGKAARSLTSVLTLTTATHVSCDTRCEIHIVTNVLWHRQWQIWCTFCTIANFMRKCWTSLAQMLNKIPK